MDREPEIATRVHEAARNRLGGESPLGDGDLLATELKVEAHDFAARGAENGSS
jgi:hypothetical protein